jgi:hypothetical protein
MVDRQVLQGLPHSHPSDTAFKTIKGTHHVFGTLSALCMATVAGFGSVDCRWLFGFPRV